MATKTALYMRVSTEHQADEGYSLEIQRERLEAYTKSQGHTNYEFYTDPGFSGGTLERPQMQRLLFEMQEGLIERVVVLKLDRLSRNQRDILYLVEDVFNKRNISLVSITESIDTGTPVGRTVISMLAMFAQFEKETIRERMVSGLVARAKSGKWRGGRVPFGYDYDPETGLLHPNDDAETVRNIFKWYLSGMSVETIAIRAGFGDRHYMVRNILTSDSNIGNIKAQGQVFSGAYEAIIDKETFERARLMREQRAKARVCGRAGHLLTGIIYCGRCGARLQYIKYRKDAYNLSCFSRTTAYNKQYMVKDPTCKQPMLRAAQVEEGVLQALFEFGHEIKNRSERVKAFDGMNAALLARQEALKRKIRKLYHLMGDGGNEELIDVVNETRAELETVSSELDASAAKALNPEMLMNKEIELASNLQEAWPDMDKNERSSAVRQLIRSVTIDGEEVTINFIF